MPRLPLFDLPKCCRSKTQRKLQIKRPKLQIVEGAEIPLQSTVARNHSIFDMDNIRKSVSGDKVRVFLGTPILSWLMLFGLVVMWGSSFGLTKVAVASILVETIVAARLAIAAIILFAVLRVTGRGLPTDQPLWAAFL